MNTLVQGMPQTLVSKYSFGAQPAQQAAYYCSSQVLVYVHSFNAKSAGRSRTSIALKKDVPGLLKRQLSPAGTFPFLVKKKSLQVKENPGEELFLKVAHWPPDCLACAVPPCKPGVLQLRSQLSRFQGLPYRTFKPQNNTDCTSTK